MIPTIMHILYKKLRYQLADLEARQSKNFARNTNLESERKEHIPGIRTSEKHHKENTII
jgi:hypothetical protein